MQEKPTRGEDRTDHAEQGREDEAGHDGAYAVRRGAGGVAISARSHFSSAIRIALAGSSAGAKLGFAGAVKKRTMSDFISVPLVLGAP